MKKFCLVLAFLAFFGLQAAMAQTTVTGTVSDTEGMPIPGATVYPQGSPQNGTVTTGDGTYKLEVPAGETLIKATFIGKLDKVVEIAGRSVVDIVMENEDVGIDEVIVTAYGTSKKSTFTGSVGVIDSDELNDVPVASVDMAIAGRTAGVQVGSGSGLPGSVNAIRIRGVGSISSSNEPLYVIDGVPVISGDIGRLETSSVSALATLNTSDIASISVLKDAAAASLYGSRAANGVILITTKKGKAGKTKFTLKSSYGITDFATDNAEWASPEEAAEYNMTAFKNAFLTYGEDDATATASAQSYFDYYFPKYDPNRPDSDYDWMGELFSKGATQNHQFIATGGNKSTSFYTSFGYFDITGISGNFLNRYSGRINLDHKANEVVSLGINTSFSATSQETQPTNSWWYANPMWAKQFSVNQLSPIWNEDGTYNLDLNGYPNLVRERELQEQGENIYRSQSNMYLSANIIEGLQAKTIFGFDLIMGDSYMWWPPISNDGAPKGYASKQNTIRKVLTSSNTLNYNKELGSGHRIDALVGYEIQSSHYDRTFTDGEGFPNSILGDLDNAATPTGTGTYYSDDRTISYLSRLNYDYNNKYYGSVSFRRDGSSKLGANNRWGNFWSASAGWRLKEEAFLSDVSWLNALKLRGSYGVNGTLPTDRYGTLALYSYGANYGSNPGMEISQVENPNLEWEKNYTYNIGIDMRVFDNISIEMEYYDRTTKDLLLEVPVPRTSGLGSVWKNVGEMNNRGFEVSINSVNFSKGDFVWITNLNLSTNKNKIVKLNNHENIQDFPYILREGESYNTFYMRDWAGIDPETGEASWYVIEQEINDDGIITGEHRVDEDGDGEWDKTQNSAEALKTSVGTADPKLIGGLMNSFSYKGIELSFLFSFKIGGKSYYDQASMSWSDGYYAHQAPVQKYVYDNTWREPGDNAEFPKPNWDSGINSYYNSSRRLHDASYLRLKNLSLSYTLPNTITEKAKMQNVRVYMNATNMLTFAKFDFYDPEVSIRGVGFLNADFPPLKTITFGLELNF